MLFFLTGLFPGGFVRKKRRTEAVCRLTTHEKESFVATDFFQPGKTAREEKQNVTVGEVKISMVMGVSFREFFLPLIERDIQPDSILINRLLVQSNWIDLSTENGHQETMIRLYHFWKVLSLPIINASEKGTSVSAFIFTCDNKPMEVVAIKIDDGWYLDASLPSNKPNQMMPDGHIICSRQPL